MYSIYITITIITTIYAITYNTTTTATQQHNKHTYNINIISVINSHVHSTMISLPNPQCAENYLYSNIDTDIYNYTHRIKIANKQYSKYEYITCFRFESNEYKDTTYYSYFIKCPQFEDICYNKNPWICNGHGMINSHSTNIENKCFCNHGYIGCDCTIRNTQTNKFNTQLIDNTCVENTEEDDDAFGSMPVENEKDMDLDYLGLVNVTMQMDDRYSIENIIKTLRLWVAIDVKIHENNVWIQSYKEIVNRNNKFSGQIHNDNKLKNYSISIAYYDHMNKNKIIPKELVKEFQYLFNVDSNQKPNDNKFILYDIYNIKEPTSNAENKSILLISLFVTVFYIYLF
eukprot:424014_1